MKKLNVLIITVVLYFLAVEQVTLFLIKQILLFQKRSLSDISRITAGSSVGMERFFYQVTYIRIMRCLNCSARSIRY